MTSSPAVAAPAAILTPADVQVQSTEGHLLESATPTSATASECGSVAPSVSSSAPSSPPKSKQGGSTARSSRISRESFEAAVSGDEVLGRLLKDVLRHKAKELGAAISPDGWMAVNDALDYVNSFKHSYGEAEVREEVANNPKRRFQLQDTQAGLFIRAAQGHSMAGVGEEMGEVLTRADAPRVAVHGTYLRNLDTILNDGLSKMGRHHVHLARGLLGEPGVVSGMRRNTEVYVWVNVHAAMDSGIRFFETSNGVILCEGIDGKLPPSFFSVVIELRGGLVLSAPQLRLIERLFAGCSRVTIKKMHGGFSGSLVLRTDSYDADGHPEEPTVTKVDDAPAMLREVEETEYISGLAGADAIRVLRGPIYIDDTGEYIEMVAADEPNAPQPQPPWKAPSTTLAGSAPPPPPLPPPAAPTAGDAGELTSGAPVGLAGLASLRREATDGSKGSLVRRVRPSCEGPAFGAVVLEMAGACWVLPEFSMSLGKQELVQTFKEQLMSQLGRLADHEGSEASIEISDTESDNSLRVVRELWGAGGPLAVLVSKSAIRAAGHSSDPRGSIVNEWYESTVAAAVIAFLPPASEELLAREHAYETPATLRACFTSLRERGARFDLIKKRMMWADSFVLQCGEEVWGDAACAPLVKLIEELDALRDAVPEWLAGSSLLRCYQHGDLNAANVLIDLRGSLWLIDFASTGPNKNPFTDAAKLVSALLFEYFPIPLSLREVREASVQKLKDAFGIHSYDTAEALQAVWRTCEDKASVLQAAEAMEVDEDVMKRLWRIADDATSQKRMEEGKELVDAFLAPTGDDGRLPELWEIGQRKPHEQWPLHMQLTFSLCTAIVRIVTELVADCSQKAEVAAAHSERARSLPADLHAIHFMLPLLVRALCCVRYSGLSVYQMRLAWYASQKLARLLLDVVHRTPAPPPSFDTKPSKELKLAAGLPVLLVADKGARLDGREGVLRLGVAHGDAGDQAITLGGLASLGGAAGAVQEEGSRHGGLAAPLASASLDPVCTIDFDGMSQMVLPYLHSHEDVQPALEEARIVAQSLHELQALKSAAEAAVESAAAAPAETNEIAERMTSVLDALSEASLMLRGEVKEARKAIAAARRGNLADRKTLEKGSLARGAHGAAAMERESGRVEATFCRQLARAATIDPAPFEAVEEELIKRLRTTGAAGLRLYATGQELNVLAVDGTWRDVAVIEQAAAPLKPHKLRDLHDARYVFELVLHPFNHGPRDVSAVRFAALQKRHNRSLRNAHSAIVDALSGRRLNVFDQCVPIDIGAVSTSEDVSPLERVHDVAGLAAWLQGTHDARTRGKPATACVLLTAGPAAGKTCLMSQLVMHTLEQSGGLVPVLVKIQNLQRHLLSPANRERFARSWNWVDAYLQSVHGAESELYRMLRQAMLARRTLLLLDGLDEGGQVRAQIERHVTEVLAPQGHVMLVTSRPAGVREELFSRHFHRVVLKPLSDEQQRQVIEQRIDAEFVDEMMQYVSDRVPHDMQTGIRVTGNPLMLSMVVSIFESRVVQSRLMQRRVSTQMPQTIAELYQVASNTMLQRVDRKERGNAASVAAVPHLRRLLEATFFQAHSAQRRVIDDEHLETAALDLHDPGQLAALRWPDYDGDASAGHYAQIISGEHTGRFATVTRVNPRGECAVELEDGRRVAWVRVKSSGLVKGAFVAEYGDAARGRKIREAVALLGVEMRDALQTIRERVAQDRLPLLSLLQADPLEVQSSHLSFQEYFAANAICKGWRLSKAAVAPWQWPVWWANALRLGSEMGEDFGRGLLESTDEDRRSAGFAMGHLSLGGSIGGHRPTSLGAVAEMMRAASIVELPRNRITAEESALFAGALRCTATLTDLDLHDNDLGDVGVTSLAGALRENTACALRCLDLTYNNFRADGARALAGFVASSRTLQELALRNNELGEEGCGAVAVMLQSKALMRLDISGTKLTLRGIEAIGTALRTNASLTSLSVQDLEDDALRVLGVALHANPGNKLRSITCDAFETVAPSAAAQEGAESDARSATAALPIPVQHVDVRASGFGTGSTLLLANVLKVTIAPISLNIDSFAVPVEELKGSVDTTRALRLSLRAMPSATNVSAQVGLLLGSLLSANTLISSATLVNDFGVAAGSDFALPLAQLTGEGSVMYVDLKGVIAELRAVVAGAVVGAFLRICEAIHRLDLRCCPLLVDGGKAIAEALRYNASITSLSLMETQLGDEGVEHLAAALQANEQCALTSINLADNGITARGAQAMAEALHSTRHLTALDGVGMTGTYFRQLRAVDPVKALELRGLGDADSVIIGRLLGSNNTLTSLDLGSSSNNMGKAWGRAIAEALTTNTTLTSLNLGSNGMGDAGGAAVADALQGKNFKIAVLDVSNNRLGRSSWRGFANVLGSEANLTTLNIGSNDIGDTGGRAIFEALARNQSLTSLNISAARLCEKAVGASDGDETFRGGASQESNRRLSKVPEDAKSADNPSVASSGTAVTAPKIRAPEKTAIDALTVVLRTNVTLRVLDISANELSEKALRAVSSALRRNSSLTSVNGVGKSGLYYKQLRGRVSTLDLKGVGLGAEDLTILCDLLSSNTTLTSLDLSSNALGDDGGKAVAAALNKNDTMASLDLSSTGIGMSTGKALLEMLSTGSALSSVVVAGNALETQMKAVGFNADMCKAIGFTPQMLKTGGFTAHELREAGYKAKELKAAGFNAQALADGGFPANQLKLVGFTDTELKECGFTPQELKSKLGLEGVAAVRQLDLSVDLPMTWDIGSRDKKYMQASSSRS